MTADDPLLPKVVEALRMLVDYVDRRPDEATADDDVKALEDVAFILKSVSHDDAARLRPLLGDRLSEALGVGEP